MEPNSGLFVIAHNLSRSVMDFSTATVGREREREQHEVSRDVHMYVGGRGSSLPRLLFLLFFTAAPPFGIIFLQFSISGAGGGARSRSLAPHSPVTTSIV